MASLFRNRFSRPAAPRRRRVRAAAPAMPLERLEPRLALAGDTFSRPILERAATLVMDASIGPNPVVMSKSQVVGNDVKSFVISHVPEGSVVEKWDAATEKWFDVSTKPTSSNPQELMRLLGTRVIHQGDKIQWRPKAGFEGAAQQAFQMINWDDGSELLGASAEAPSAVQNLEVSPTGVGELTVSWESPATGDATSYSVTMTTTTGKDIRSETVKLTTDLSAEFTNLSPADAFSFAVTASNLAGDSSPAEIVSFHQIITALEPTRLTTGLDGSIWVAAADGLRQITHADGVWAIQSPIQLDSWPLFIVTGHDGSIWASIPNDQSVQQVVNINGDWVAEAAISVKGRNPFPSGLTVGHDGSIWVALQNNDMATSFAVQGVQRIVNSNGIWGTSDADYLHIVGHPYVLTTGRDGSIFVAAYTNKGRVSCVYYDDGDNTWKVGDSINTGARAAISSITAAHDGSVWVADYGDNYLTQVAIKDSEGTLEKQASVDVTSPNVLATGLDGLIWVAFGSGVCDVGYLSPDNGWSLETVAQAGVFAQGLTAGLDGSIWVSSSVSGTVQQILRPAYKPISLASAFGPGPGEMTLAWQPPVIDGGTPVISYTATVFQGNYTQTIMTSDTSCVFDGLTLGSGPTYFTVTATNFAGESKTAALQIDASGNPIPAQNTGIGITTDGTGTSDGGFDGSGNTYSWTALGDTSSGGALVGSSLISGGIAFEVDPNQPDFTKAAGQDIEASGSGTVLTLAAAAVNGSQSPKLFPQGSLTLNFTDDTTATGVQSVSDWCSPQYYDNESILSTQSYRNTASGGTDDTTNYIYSYGYTLPAGKTLKSITLPNNPNVRILGAVLSEPTAVDLSWNAYGLDASQGQVPNKPAGFDGNGNYYNANYYNNGGYGGVLGLQTASNSDQDTDKWDYRTITWGGATFNLGPAPNKYSVSNNRQGNENFVRAYGQTIDLSNGDFSTLVMIGAGANGNQTDQVITLTFTDGSTAQWTQSFTDWRNNKSTNNPPPSGAALGASGEALVAVTTVINQVGNQAGSKNNPANAFVYGYTYDIPAGKTLESITLPNNENIGILGMALV